MLEENHDQPENHDFECLPWFLSIAVICIMATIIGALCTKYFVPSVLVPTVLWRCWLGGRKGIRPVKNWVVMCWRGYSVWSEVQTCICPDNHASTPPLSFLQAGCPSCRPTNSIKVLKAKGQVWSTTWILVSMVGGVWWLLWLVVSVSDDWCNGCDWLCVTGD